MVRSEDLRKTVTLKNDGLAVVCVANSKGSDGNFSSVLFVARSFCSGAPAIPRRCVAYHRRLAGSTRVRCARAAIPTRTHDSFARENGRDTRVPTGAYDREARRQPCLHVIFWTRESGALKAGCTSIVPVVGTPL